MTARRALLDGLAHDADIPKVRGQAGPSRPPGGNAQAVPARGYLPRTAERRHAALAAAAALAGPNRTCRIRSAHGRPATSGSAVTDARGFGAIVEITLN